MNADPTTTKRLRARTLRWLLKLATANDLPMPRRIEFAQIVSTVSGEIVRFLTLDLDDDSTDLIAWAMALDAASIEEYEVTGETHKFTSACAARAWNWDTRVDWNRIEVRTRYGFQPLADIPAVTA